MLCGHWDNVSRLMPTAFRHNFQPFPQLPREFLGRLNFKLCIPILLSIRKAGTGIIPCLVTLPCMAMSWSPDRLRGKHRFVAFGRRFFRTRHRGQHLHKLTYYEQLYPLVRMHPIFIYL